MRNPAVSKRNHARAKQGFAFARGPGNEKIMEGKIMKHTKLLVVALLVALMACLAMSASADTTTCTSPSAVNGQHVWVSYPALDAAATCTTQGRIGFQCANVGCGETNVIYTPATGHVWGAYEQVKNATCVSDGQLQRKCTVCGHYDTANIKYEPKATGNHNWVTIRDAVAPTCTVNGYKKMEECSVCKATRGGDVVPATGHDVTAVAWTVKREASCALEGIIVRKCSICGADVETQTVAKTANHSWKLIIPQKDASCTTDGCKAKYQCEICGAFKGGELIPAFGHDLDGVAWEVKRESSCALEGIIVRKCRTCGQEIEKQTVAKNSNHSWQVIIPQKDATCTTTGCKAMQQCEICGATKGGDTIPAKGHVWVENSRTPATCTADGKVVLVCSNDANHKQEIKIPAMGHSATWAPTGDAANGYLIWELRCSICNQVLATQVVMNGDKAPSGTVNTAKAAVDASYTATAKGTVDVAKATTTKTTTAKSTTKTSSTKSSTAKTAAAPATTAAKTATVAAAAPVVLEDNQVQLVADKHLYVVKNVAGEEIVLTVNVKDGKITVEANLAEGESLVLYANTEAIENPTADNTLVLTANEAVELPEAFANAILAVVKTESLPVALAAK